MAKIRKISNVGAKISRFLSNVGAKIVGFAPNVGATPNFHPPEATF